MTAEHNTQPAAKRLPVLIGILVGLVILTLVVVIVKPGVVMPVIAEAPAYELVDQNGEPLSNTDLQGQVVLYDFVYTHCLTVCPAVTGKMLNVAIQLEPKGVIGSDVILTTITFDPERDTPQRLTDYAAQVGADQYAWYWLTGDEVRVKQLVGGEFGVYFERVEPEVIADTDGHEDHADRNSQVEAYDFVHEVLFVLVDADGMIRAEYNDLEVVNEAPQDIARVLREQNAGPFGSLLFRIAHALNWYA